MSSPLPIAKPEEVGLSQAALDRLSAALNDRIASGHIPGAVALVARHGKVAYHQSFGRQDPASDKPMGTDAIFRIYSMTKPIVSVAVMMLWEEGRLLLSDPIGKYIPAFNQTKVGVISGGSYGRDRRRPADHHPGPAAPHLRPDLRIPRRHADPRSLHQGPHRPR